MKVLLVDNLIMPEDGSLELLDVHPNLGLLSLAAVAETAGHTVEIYDPKRLLRWGHLQYDQHFYEQVAMELLGKNPEAVGFTTLGCSFLFAINVACLLKQKLPDLPVLLGGPHATMLDRPILERFPQFDIVVRHEADETFPLVLEQLERRSFERIPGITWRASDAIRIVRWTEGRPKVQDLDTLPLLSYDHYPMAQLDLDLLRIEAGRGCPFMCTFCSTASFFQRSFRLKSAERLVQELDILHDKYGFSDFKLDHDMFTVNRRKILEFCEAVKDRHYRWRASARIDCVDPELLQKMAEAGCSSLYFGIESGSTRMQEIAKKRLDLELVRPTLEIAHSFGIQTTASFITGYPEETEQDQNDSLDLLGACIGPSCLAQLHMLAPEPGTAMFAQLGDRIEYDGYGGRYNALLVDAEDEQLILENPEIFQTYYYYPAAMPRWRYIFAVEAVDLLRIAGELVFRYILRAYEGRLSLLVQDFRIFMEAHRDEVVPTSADAEAFLACRFGDTHHLVSLYGYGVRAGRLGQNGSSHSIPRPFHPEQKYVRNTETEFLHGYHDFSLLKYRIENDSEGKSLLPDEEFGERGTYYLAPTEEGPVVYRVDPEVEAVVELFEQPRSCSEVAAFLSRVIDLPAGGSNFFEHLARLQMIVPATTAFEQRKSA